MTRHQLRTIMRAACARHGVSEADILVRDRTARIVAARWEAWADCWRAGETYTAIAAVGGWDHTSVAHGVKAHLRKSRLALAKNGCHK